MSKEFEKWNTLKQQLHNSKKENFFKERDVFWASIGINIGFEQDGKGDISSRPIVVLKKYNKSNALLVQARVYDAKRLENKIGKISQEDFSKLKKKFKELVNV